MATSRKNRNPEPEAVEPEVAESQDEATEPATESEQDETKARSAAYAAAERRLREAHKDEFEGYKKEELETRGLTYTRRLTADERAAKEAREKLEQIPEEMRAAAR